MKLLFILKGETNLPSLKKTKKKKKKKVQNINHNNKAASINVELFNVQINHLLWVSGALSEALTVSV